MDEISADTPLVKFYRFLPGARAPRTRRPFGRRLDADARVPLLRGDAHGLGARLVCVSADEFQADVGRRQRRRLELRKQRQLVFARAPRSFRISRSISTASRRRKFRATRRPSSDRSRIPAGLMLWSGFVARTAPGWSLLVRQPANLTRSLGYESLRRHHRDRPLVRPAVRQSSVDAAERADRVRRELPLSSGPAGASQRLWRGARQASTSSSASRT